MVDDALLAATLGHTLDATDFRALGAKYQGKVRDNYTTKDGRRFIVVTDRISAFDRVLGTIPFKGQVLNRLAAWWFAETRDVAPNHLLGTPDPNVLECVECTPILAEMVVRDKVVGRVDPLDRQPDRYVVRKRGCPFAVEAEDVLNAPIIRDDMVRLPNNDVGKRVGLELELGANHPDETILKRAKYHYQRNLPEEICNTFRDRSVG